MGRHSCYWVEFLGRCTSELINDVRRPTTPNLLSCRTNQWGLCMFLMVGEAENMSQAQRGYFACLLVFFQGGETISDWLKKREQKYHMHPHRTLTGVQAPLSLLMGLGCPSVSACSPQTPGMH
ncbi:unnamed protein product, partial [Discosporangium mesarthrocarpum]